MEMTDEISYEDRRRRAGKLRDARRAKGLTQPQAAEAAGFPSPRALQDWEAGRRVPQSDQLLRIERALGIDYDTNKRPDLNAVSPDVYAMLVALAIRLESLEPHERGQVLARLISSL